MLLDKLTELLSLLVVLSVAGERLVEILKTFVFKSLNRAASDADKEARRQGLVQLLAVATSLLTAALLKSGGQLPDGVGWVGTISLGFLASGGSSLWNSLLGWSKGLKDVNKTAGEAARRRG